MDAQRDTQVLADRKKALEEQFFARQERELVEQMRRKAAQTDRREALAEASGIQDPEILDRLVALDLDGATVAALGLVPLVEMAWADGAVHEREREAVLRAAEQAGTTRETAAHVLLESWLDRRPEPALLDAWKDYAGALAASLPGAERQALRHDLLDRARTVAEAAGGFLGVGKVSDAEEAVLEELEAALA